MNRRTSFVVDRVFGLRARGDRLFIVSRTAARFN
jgi:hypothetical protein